MMVQRGGGGVGLQDESNGPLSFTVSFQRQSKGQSTTILLNSSRSKQNICTSWGRVKAQNSDREELGGAMR